MKKDFWHRCLVLVLSSATFFMSSCVSEPILYPTSVETIVTGDTANTNSMEYNRVLAEAISNADKIVFKEHSHKVDFFGVGAGENQAPHYVYRTKELSYNERSLFLEGVRNLRGVSKNTRTLCIFVPHHTIDFYEEGRLKSSMKISYKCFDIEWNGTTLEASKDVFNAISPAIVRAGMDTHRSWDVLAKSRYAEENNAGSIEREPIPLGPPTAKWAAGQVGKKVVNPFTGKLVDVEGIPANTKVRDPNDEDSSHVFRVPDL